MSYNTIGNSCTPCQHLIDLNLQYGATTDRYDHVFLASSFIHPAGRANTLLAALVIDHLAAAELSDRTATFFHQRITGFTHLHQRSSTPEAAGHELAGNNH